jgi:hypothetical protein
MRRSRWAALAVLVGVAVVLLLAHRGQEPRGIRAHTTPPRLREHEVARIERRATLAPRPHTDAPARPKRDPFLVALPVKPNSPVVVFEVNALRYSPVGERFLACVKAQDRSQFADTARAIGIDPLTDIDRVAFLGEATVVSGKFDRARWSQVGSAGEPYGRAGRLYTTSRGTVGAWRDEIVVQSSRPEDVRAAIDQLEGRAAPPETQLPEELTYGEIYGLIPGAAARQAFGGQGGLTDRLAALASRIEVHVDAMEGLSAQIRVRGDDVAGLSTMAKGLGAILTAARANSRTTGNKSLAALLESAAVHPGDGELSIDLAVPAARVDELLGDCKMFAPPTQPADDRAQDQPADAVPGRT